jgi:hypothetical protein
MVSLSLGLTFRLDPRVCSMERYSEASWAAKANVSIICVLWVFIILMFCPLRPVTARALPAGMVLVAMVEGCGLLIVDYV